MYFLIELVLFCTLCCFIVSVTVTTHSIRRLSHVSTIQLKRVLSLPGRILNLFVKFNPDLRVIGNTF